jgi:hypothetical protein
MEQNRLTYGNLACSDPAYPYMKTVKAPNRRTSCPSRSRPGGTATQCSSDPISMPAALGLTRLSCGGSGTLRFDATRTSRRRLTQVGWCSRGIFFGTRMIRRGGGGDARVAFSQTESRGRHRVTNDVGAFLRNHANDGHKVPMKARFPRPTASGRFYPETVRPTKLIPVVQLRSGVIVLMGGRSRPVSPARVTASKT